MKKTFITIERIKILDEGFNYLEHYGVLLDEVHHIGTDIDTVDAQKTKLLK